MGRPPQVSSRLVLSEVMTSLGVPDDKFAATCVLIDKLEKVPRDAIQEDLAALGLSDAIVDKLLDTLTISDFAQLREVLGAESPACEQLERLFDYADAYGIKPW